MTVESPFSALPWKRAIGHQLNWFSLLMSFSFRTRLGTRTFLSLYTRLGTRTFLSLYTRLGTRTFISLCTRFRARTFIVSKLTTILNLSHSLVILTAVSALYCHSESLIRVNKKLLNGVKRTLANAPNESDYWVVT